MPIRKSPDAKKQSAPDVFLLPHFQRGKNKRQDEVKNERRGQHHAAVKRDLERDKKSARRAQVDEVDVQPLRVGHRVRVFNHVPAKNPVRADRDRRDLHNFKTVCAEVPYFLLFFRQLEIAEMVCAEVDDGNLVRVGITHFCVRQRPFQNPDGIVARDEAEEHCDGQGDAAFYKNPAKIFEVFEKTFDRTALFVRVRPFRFVVVGHARKNPASGLGRIGIGILRNG